MIIVNSFEEAQSLGAETVIKDSDTRWRCYMPGEITRPVVPDVITVTPLQLRKALNQSGLRASVDAALAASPIEVRDEWETAQEFHVDHASVIAMTAAIGKTDADRIALFELAATL